MIIKRQRAFYQERRLLAMEHRSMRLTEKEKSACSKRFAILFLTTLFLLGFATTVTAGPKAKLWSKWLAHDVQSQTRIDHKAWNRFLEKYLISDHPSGINRFRYAAVTTQDRKELEDYLKRLQGVQVSGLNRAEQKAYWINLYNALTVKVILDHYPVKSIRDIKISPGLFKFGPWGAKLATIEGEQVTLDDIEHRILRPIWKDNRVHYAVNCASIGCPNLQPEAVTSANTEGLLEKGAREYVNHPRGARIERNRLNLSNIYKWFREDFGGSKEEVIQHLLKYAEDPLAESLKDFRGKIKYEYDWALNQ
jgi:hypothetical protein